MAKNPRTSAPDPGAPRVEPFQPGALVIATLGNPREKFWGKILALAPEGVSLTGIELASFDDLTALVRDQEPFTPVVVFFPMHRIERLELDLPDGSLPSLAQRFHTKTGFEAVNVLVVRDDVRAGMGPADLRGRAPKDRA
jgi:hypothetical protein